MLVIKTAKELTEDCVCPEVQSTSTYIEQVGQDSNRQVNQNVDGYAKVTRMDA